MAKKKPTPVDKEPQVPIAPEQPKSATADRHKPRRAVHIPPRLYDALQLLAQRNRRPLNWELRVLLEDVLTKEGFWPPAEAEEDTE